MAAAEVAAALIFQHLDCQEAILAAEVNGAG
jgi:hypothetical protein